MNFMNPGFSGLILIIIALLLVFGPSKLPEIGRAFGKSLREFKEATRGIVDDESPSGRQSNAGSANTAQTTSAVQPIELKEDNGDHNVQKP